MRKIKRWIVKHLLRDWPKQKVKSVILNAIDDHKCLGLFEGMKYISKSIGSEYYPKLLGTYEKELNPFFKKLFQQPFDQFIDVGAAEGYYAVGITLRTNWDVVAFEANPNTPLPELARINGVEDRIALHGACDLGDLSKTLKKADQNLLLVDIEGAELMLLDPGFIPELRSAAIIVEVHDCFIPDIGERILARFKNTHQIERIDCEPRTFEDCPVDFPKLPFDPALYTLEYLTERRPEGMYWLTLFPK